MSDHIFNQDFCKDDVHGWFNLTYASYFAMPRSVMQSMSAEWQHAFVELIEQVEDLYGGYDMDYTVHLTNQRGRFTKDPLRDYERGRRFVEPKPYDFGDPTPLNTKDKEL